MTKLTRLSGALALATVALSACAVTHAQNEEFLLTWSGDTLLAREGKVHALDDSAARSGIVNPRSVRAANGQAFVSDLAADRVAVLDSNLTVTRWIGSTGSGPGELHGVGHLAIRDSQLFVGDALNGRVAEFTLSGRFVRTYPSPFAAGMLSATDNDIFSSARSESEFAMLLDTQAVPHVALRRPPLTRSERRENRAPMRGHDLIASDSVDTWVFDQAYARLCRYAAASAAPQCTALPASLTSRLHAYTDERVQVIEKALKVRVVAAPLAKDMIRFGTSLALLLPLPELPLVLIDVTDGTLTPVVYRDAPIPDWIRAARSFAWDGHAFVLAGDSAVGRLFVGRKPAR